MTQGRTDADARLTTHADVRRTTNGVSRARTRVWLAEVALLLMAIIWGVNFSIIKYGTTVVPPLAFNGVRITLAAIILAVIAFALGGPAPARRDLIALLALGALGNGIYQVLFVEGLALTRAGEAALVVGASPALMALIGRMRGVERVDKRRVAGIALSIFGVGLVVLGRATSGGNSQGGSLVGDLLVLVGAVCWAVYTILLIPYTTRVSGWWVTALSIVGGSMVLLVVGGRDIVAVDWTAVPRNAWLAILYGSVLALVIAFFFWYYGIRVLGPTRTALYGNLQPLIALLVAWLLLHEVPTVWQGLGAATIVSGVLLTRVPASEVS
jgi:drug/metabolite transporter (DMT)-like permease